MGADRAWRRPPAQDTSISLRTISSGKGNVHKPQGGPPCPRRRPEEVSPPPPFRPVNARDGELASCAARKGSCPALGIQSRPGTERASANSSGLLKREFQGTAGHFVRTSPSGLSPAVPAVAPYPTRARPGAAVSMPLAWNEFGAAIGPDYFTVQKASCRLANLHSDPLVSGSRTLPAGRCRASGGPAPGCARRRSSAPATSSAAPAGSLRCRRPRVASACRRLGVIAPRRDRDVECATAGLDQVEVELHDAQLAEDQLDRRREAPLGRSSPLIAGNPVGVSMLSPGCPFTNAERMAAKSPLATAANNTAKARAGALACAAGPVSGVPAGIGSCALAPEL